jgi:uncharacterized membrane protein YidH (DUF202 family)
MKPRRPRIAWDRGIASERTVLAWERQAIATIALAVLVVRAGIVKSELLLAIPVGALLLLAAASEYLFSVRIYAEHDRPIEEGAILHERAIGALTALTVIAAAASIALSIA